MENTENFINDSEGFKDFINVVKENLEKLENTKKHLDLYVDQIRYFYNLIESGTKFTAEDITELCSQADALENNFLDTIDF